MIITTNINGFETPIEFPDHAIPQVQTSGDKSSWAVDFGNGFKQVGGILAIPFINETETTATLTVPFGTLFDFQATPLDVKGPLGEAVHIELQGGGQVRIYARTSQNYTGSFFVKWSASGVA